MSEPNRSVNALGTHRRPFASSALLVVGAVIGRHVLQQRLLAERATHHVEWAAGQRRDWVPTASGGYDLGPGGSYDLGFRTFPASDSATPLVR